MMNLIIKYEKENFSQAFQTEIQSFESLCNNVVSTETIYKDTKRRSTSKNQDEAKSYKKNLKQHDTNRMRARFQAAKSAWRLSEIAKNPNEEAAVRQILEVSKLTTGMRSHEAANFAALME